MNFWHFHLQQRKNLYHTHYWFGSRHGHLSSLYTTPLLFQRCSQRPSQYEECLLQHCQPSVQSLRINTLNIKSIVKFDEVPINEGNHFNSGDGIFVAPVSGTYQFSWTTLIIRIVSSYL
jgi:hypothetical protein